MEEEIFMRSYFLLAFFIVGVFGIGSAIGITFQPAAWYDTLMKPFFNPPAWLFGPAWTVLYICIGIAGWRTVQMDTNGPQTILWFTQMIFNFAWSPIVFGLQLLWPGVAVVLTMLVLIIAFIYVAWENGDQVSAWLFVPYAAWVTFASILNISLAWLNPATT